MATNRADRNGSEIVAADDTRRIESVTGPDFDLGGQASTAADTAVGHKLIGTDPRAI